MGLLLKSMLKVVSSREGGGGRPIRGLRTLVVADLDVGRGRARPFCGPSCVPMDENVLKEKKGFNSCARRFRLLPIERRDSASDLKLLLPSK